MTAPLEDYSHVLKRWFPVGLWMVIIIAASTEWGSAGHSFHILRSLLRWFEPGIPDPEIYRINIIFRKAMHVIEFAVLAIMVWKVYRPLRHFPQAGDLRLAGLAMGVALAFGVGSEMVQSLFPHDRGASVWDVILDLGGALLGLLVVWAFRSRRL